MACRCPHFFLFQMEGNSDCIFSDCFSLSKRQFIFFRTQWLNCCFQCFCTNHFSILCKYYLTVKSICVYKQILVNHFYCIRSYFCSNILIIKFHFLHLRRWLSVTAICDSVTAKIIVCRTFSEIAAICLELFSIAVFLINRLVNVIPDKSALIFGLCICQVSIFVHGTAGISHGMCILTADKRFTVILCQELFDCFYRWIHLAFHITGIIITAVMEKSFIMYQTGRIILTEKLRHFIDIFSAKRFISTGPDQDCRMILVSLIHGVGTVKHHIQPFRFVVRNNMSIILCKFRHIPGTMGFQVCLIDHINTIFITKLIDQ